ncbi:MAG TPA: phosphoserine phosphatase SerB [Bryobacteraceae bacterium]|nr:phosphoserine phosphatase SerB [Bryobacteraceae bacterium]
MPNLPQQTRVLHIDITGQDKSGVTHSLTEILGGAGVRILDIGQAVIHNALALGILVELTDDIKSSPLLTDLLLKAHELGVQIRFTAISEPEYQAWVESQTKGRFIVTALGRSITARHLAEISGIVARTGLNIDRIDRLSGRTSLSPRTGPDRVCVELAVSGEIPDEDTFRASLMQLTSQLEIDIAFQRDNVYRRNRRLVAFDMDSTLIRTEVIDELAKLAGVGAQVQAITESAMRGELDFQASFRKRVALLKGLPESSLKRVLERVPLMDGAERLIATLKRLGYKTAILSGGFTFVGRELQRKLGIDYLHANELEIRDGVVTGEVSCEIVDGARKAALLAEIARAENLSMEQVIAVGDGANDLPMLRLAGLGIAYRAKPLVRRSARQSISRMGLDGILFLLGVRDRESFECASTDSVSAGSSRSRS